MKFHLSHRVFKRQMEILLRARLLLLVTCVNVLHKGLEKTLRRNYGRRLSLLKFMNFHSKSPANFIRVISSINWMIRRIVPCAKSLYATVAATSENARTTQKCGIP